jgi:pimeloyl-ACP methyl ester carboxylesterase
VHGLVKRSVLSLFSTLQRCRALFFSAGTADEVVIRCLSRLTEESNRVILDLIRWGAGPRHRSANRATPVLVVGGREDGLFSAGQVEHTAALYGADTLILADTGHNVMMERKVALRGRPHRIMASSQATE